MEAQKGSAAPSKGEGEKEAGSGGQVGEEVGKVKGGGGVGEASKEEENGAPSRSRARGLLLLLWGEDHSSARSALMDGCAAGLQANRRTPPAHQSEYQIKTLEMRRSYYRYY